MKMKIREEKPPKQKRSTLQFPELRDLKRGQVAVYDLGFLTKVRASVAWLRRYDGRNLKTVTDPDANEIKVWLEEADTTTEKE